MVQIHFHYHCQFVFNQSKVWSQDIRQSHNHVLVHQEHALQFASAMRVWNSEQLMRQLLVYGFIFSGMPLVSSLQTK